MLICTIFNVDHGFSAFIRSPNGYGLLIDCGSREYFSPVKWVRGHYNSGNRNIKYFEKRRIAEFYLSHPHLDHFTDIGSLVRVDKPKHFTRDKQTMSSLDNKIRNEKSEAKKNVMKMMKNFSTGYKEDINKNVNWGFDSFQHGQIRLSDAKSVSSTPDKIINNRSLIISVSYAGKKLLFPGDIEIEGWEKAFESDKIKSILKDTNFFIASHHGHKNGFTSKILDYTGVPDVYIVSAREGDENIDSNYSKKEYSKGFKVQGDRDISRMISTRKRAGAIQVLIDNAGFASMKIVTTNNNLNENQKRLRTRRTGKASQQLKLKSRLHQ